MLEVREDISGIDNLQLHLPETKSDPLNFFIPIFELSIFIDRGESHLALIPVVRIARQHTFDLVEYKKQERENARRNISRGLY